MLLVAPGHSAIISTPQKIEVHRTLTATEQADEIALSQTYSSRRVRAVWPDEVGLGGLSFPGYHLCAALAALSCGVAPHRPLTNVSVAGFDDVSRSVDLFNRAQMDRMAGAGVWIVTQDLQSGAIYNRHAVTSGDTDDLNDREEVITRNLDDISYYFQSVLAPFIGVSNVTDSLITIIDAELNAGKETLRARNFSPLIGGQLIDAEVTELRRHLTLRDRILIRMSLELPAPFNNGDLYLVV